MEPVSARVGDRQLRLTNLDKVLYRATGTTKADMITYVDAVAPALLAQLRGRIVTRKRWPEGTSGEMFFEKNAPKGRPDWVPTARIEHEHRGRERHSLEYVLVDERATLVWLVQVGALELHTPQWRLDAAGDPLPPDRLVVDLDPGPGTGLEHCAEVALAARDMLGEAGLTASPVLSGSKGLHLYAPVTGLDSEQVVDACQLLAEGLAARLPKLVVTRMAKELRHGRVFVDWSQNVPAKTTVTPYSPRGLDRPTVAAPVLWSEVEAGGLQQLTIDEVADRYAELGDPLSA